MAQERSAGAAIHPCRRTAVRIRPGALTQNSAGMDSRSFFELVADMRSAQKSYFRTRVLEALVASKTLESKVDAEIARVRAVLSSRENADTGDENSEK